MKKLFCSPMFLVGLVIRLAFIALVLPKPVVDWYAPFLDTSLSAFGIDPWQTWLDALGSSAAFPYGYVMWLALIPAAAVCKMLGVSLVYGYGATLLVADAAILWLVDQLLSDKRRLILGVYWLSPIVILASYWLGFNDLIPVLFLVLSLFWLRGRRSLRSGLALVCAVSAKLSMVVVLPFFVIYFLHNPPYRKHLTPFIRGLVLGALLFLLPYVAISHAGMSMIANNPEMAKIYLLAFQFGDGVTLYLVPLLYLLVLYAAWRVRRMNFDLFTATLGVAFLVVVLLTPAAPGWFVWAMPLLTIYQAHSDRKAMALTALFSILYVLGSLLSNLPLGDSAKAVHHLVSEMQPRLASIMHTGMVAVGVVLALRLWRESVVRNDFFRLSRKPFVLGIAGDSGAGKDTLSDHIKALFGGHSVATLSGDDYHLWDRQKPMWQVMTHLNPMANNLEAFANDLVALTDGKAIQSRHYDHQTGRMSRPFRIKSNDFIIASGLHALYLPILRDCYNLSIYLDIDEGLRRHLKFKRDVEHRGHTPERVMNSFARREPDSERFIRPQASHADLLFSLKPIHPRMLEEGSERHPLRLKLTARSRLGLSESSLTRVLVGVCGLHVDMVSRHDQGEAELTVEGETTGADVALAARIVCPEIFEFLDTDPAWADGVAGIMQLITLAHIRQTLSKRFIW